MCVRVCVCVCVRPPTNQVIFVEGDALRMGAVATDGRDVEHARAKLDEGSALHGYLQVGDVPSVQVMSVRRSMDAGLTWEY